jgi:GNAT superfamily N-acetyltransferase
MKCLFTIVFLIVFLIVFSLVIIWHPRVFNKVTYEMFTDPYNIVNYTKINNLLKKNMSDSLSEDSENHAFISEWSKQNDLYVMYNDNIFIGMIGIKYEDCKYIIYNLYVNRKYRNRKISKILLNFIYEVLKQKYNQPHAYLYCKNHMLSFYEKLNWEKLKYNYQKNAYLMNKKI